MYSEYPSVEDSLEKTDIIHVIKHSKWTIWTVVWWPCNRVNKYLDDLMNDHEVEEEIASCEYSSGDSDIDESKRP
jgi:hypothetical protein